MSTPRFAFAAAGMAALSRGSGSVRASDAGGRVERAGCFAGNAIERAGPGPAREDMAATHQRRPIMPLATCPEIEVDDQEEARASSSKATGAEVRSVARWILSR